MRLPRSLSFIVPALLLAAAPMAASAQTGSVVGTVVKQSDGSPIAGAQVRIVGMNRGAISNAEGRYVIPAIPTGGDWPAPGGLKVTGDQHGGQGGANGVGAVDFQFLGQGKRRQQGPAKQGRQRGIVPCDSGHFLRNPIQDNRLRMPRMLQKYDSCVSLHPINPIDRRCRVKNC